MFVRNWPIIHLSGLAWIVWWSDDEPKRLWTHLRNKFNCLSEWTLPQIKRNKKWLAKGSPSSVTTEAMKSKFQFSIQSRFLTNKNYFRKVDEAEHVPRVIAMPFNAIPINFRPQYPLTHMPMQAHAQQQEQPQFPFARQPMPQQQNFQQIPLPLQPLLRHFQQQQQSPVPNQVIWNSN